MILQDDIKTILKEVVNPELNVSIVDEGIVREINIDEAKVSIILSHRYAGTPLAEYFTSIITQKLEVLPGIDSITVEFAEE
ncbi:MAG: iron-sulfur cluster assembly protein [bacterium]|nr:iron-sulfur cluster assembly protein [bacterium]MDD5755994.1 iron-sulfur cluster assembly protein [bacterium]